jgi:hypothetical protein
VYKFGHPEVGGNMFLHSVGRNATQFKNAKGSHHLNNNRCEDLNA